MSTEIDNDTERDENVVPEPTAASSFGNPSLDADKIDEDTDAKIDALLDEAIAKHSEDSEEPEEPTRDVAPAVKNLDTEIPAQQTVQQTPQASIEPQASEIDPEIAAIEQPRNLSEKNQNNWRKLQETASTYKRQAEEANILKQRLQEMESQAPQVQTPPDYEELRKFRQIFDIKNDPEFRSKYEQPLSQAKDTIYGILKKHGASDEVIQSIEKAGGPSRS